MTGRTLSGHTSSLPSSTSATAAAAEAHLRCPNELVDAGDDSRAARYDGKLRLELADERIGVLRRIGVRRTGEVDVDAALKREARRGMLDIFYERITAGYVCWTFCR
jgi:hypothetical protein